MDDAARMRHCPEIVLTCLGIVRLLSDEPAARAEVSRYLDTAVAEFGEMKMQLALEWALRHNAVLRRKGMRVTLEWSSSG